MIDRGNYLVFVDRALVGTPPPSYLGPDVELNQAGALQHVYEELAQHHGQMEIIRDAIVAEGE